MRFLLLFLLISTTAVAQQKPNIIYIMSDDHDNDAISAYNKQFISTPNLDRIAKEGARFNKAFVGNSICAPARATLLTGQHSHKNGVKNNSTRFDSSKTNIAHLLNDAGYQTALIGKWHLHSYPSGFGYWRILPGMGQYHDTRMITMKGDTIIEKGYSTDVITDDAMQWLDSRDRSKPFALFLHHKAPHRNFVPDLKYLEIYYKKKFPEPSTLYVDTAGHGSAWRIQTMSILPDMRLCGDLKIDPQYLNGIPELKPTADDIATYNAIIRRMPDAQRERYKEIYAERGKIIQQLKPTGKELLKYKYQWYMQDYIACNASIDESVGRVLKYLDDNKLTNNTAVIYTSDQGFYLGENGWFDKRFAYDVSMGTPLLIRWPEHVKANTVNNHLVQNIDYAPTLLGIAGTQAPASMQGINLVPLLEGKEKNLSRRYLYYHYYEFVKDHTVIPHIAVRGERYKLIYFYTVNEWELYDLQKDPAEQKNLIKSASHQKLILELKGELKKLRDRYDDHETASEF
ncbi:MAG TPA: sulfatase [Chitinophagaceae bacterium]|jgi:arylsulfatase A-like enzyme|nr:sulfatase [Chitinophagaceae bacterium]